MSDRPAPSTLAILKEVFWRPAVLYLAALSTLSMFISALRHTVFASLNFNWEVVQWVLSWHWQTWVVLWSVVWIIVILKGTVAAVRRREAPLTESEALSARLESELANLRAEEENVVRLSASLRTEEKAKAFLAGPQDALGQPDYVHVSELTLLIYNHGDRPVVLRGCKIWKLHATEETQELAIHDVVTSDAAKCANATETLLRVISGGRRFNFSSLQGKYLIRIVIAYSEGSAHRDAEPHDFSVTCKPWRGGTTLRIDASEVIARQS